MDDVVQRFDPLEELVRVVTGDPLEELVRDVKAQQTTLGVPHPPRTVGVGVTRHWTTSGYGGRRGSCHQWGQDVAQN
jgi:hypothetical protein